MNKFLRYSGMIQPIAIQDAIREKTIQIESYDFLKRMERFQAFKVSDAFGDFFRIWGLTLKAYYPGSKKPEDGVRDFSFKYPAEEGLPNVTITEISKDTKPGMKYFSYRSWGWFQWDNGPWTQFDLGEEANISAWDGSTIKCIYGGFTQDDATDIVEIKNLAVIEQGGVELTFDNGTPVRPHSPFSYILRETLANLYDITTVCLVADLGSAVAIGASTDVLYIGAVDRFGVIEFVLDSFLSGTTLLFEYSRSAWDEWNDLSSFNLSDSTQNFSQSGTLRFDPPNNWTFADKKVGEQNGNDIIVERYWIKISVASWGSGSARIREVTRGFRIYGQRGDALEIGIDVSKIQVAEEQESVIIRQSDSDPTTYVPAVWKKNIPIEMLLGYGSGSASSSSLLAASGFGASCREVERLDRTLAKPSFSIWGVPPFPAYKGKPRSICGKSNSEDTLWIGVGEEVWEVSDHSEFTFLFKLKTYYSTAQNRSFRIEIRRLDYDSSENALNGIAWKVYDDERFRPIQDAEANAYLGRCTPAIVFRYDLTHRFLTQHVVGAAGVIEGSSQGEWACSLPEFYSGEVFHRNGNPVTMSGVGLVQWIGNTNWVDVGGENISVPEPTFISIRRPSENWIGGSVVRLYRGRRLLLEDELGAFADPFYFSYDDTLTDPHGDFCSAKPGYYFSYYVFGSSPPSSVPLHLRFDLGQSGFVLWNASRDSYIYHDRVQGLALLERHTNLSPPPFYSWTFETLKTLASVDEQICCGANQDADNFFYGIYKWVDDADTLLPLPPAGDRDPKKSEARIYRFHIPTLTPSSALFASPISSATGSLSGSETTSGPIDIGYDSDNDLLHCCFLDRKTLEYHYVVIENFPPYTIYSTQSSTSFVLDRTRPFKRFAFLNGKMYAVCTDDRHQKEDAFLVEITFSGSTITIKKIDVIQEGDYSVETVVTVGDRLYGISKPSNTMWSYGTKWIPRVQLADFGEDNCREAATKLCQATNAVLRVDPDRVAIVEKRESIPVLISTLEDELVEVKPEKTWKFVFDGCEVSWSFEDLKATESWGLTGRNQRVLRISNELVQDAHFAAKLAEIYGKYFFKERTLLPITAKFLPQFERGDLLKIISKGIDPAKSRVVVSLRLRNSNGQIEMGLVEQ